jgi:hypothetical protein
MGKTLISLIELSKQGIKITITPKPASSITKEKAQKKAVSIM